MEITIAIETILLMSLSAIVVVLITDLIRSKFKKKECEVLSPRTEFEEFSADDILIAAEEEAKKKKAEEEEKKAKTELDKATEKYKKAKEKSNK